MSEIIDHQHEHIEHKNPEHIEHRVENNQEQKIELSENEKQEQLEAIHEKIEHEHPLEASEVLSKMNVVEEEHAVLPANNELKKIALTNYLSEIRSNLGGSAKQFSKFIHQPKINTISEFSGKTIVRPSAVLFGGLFMFIGSAVYLYATYHTNAKYNFFVAIFLFFGGFVAGLIIELFYKLILKRDF